MKEWQTIFPEKDRKVYEKSSYYGKQGFGQRPALLIIDVVGSFVGSERKDVLDAIDEHRTSCGKDAWDALPKIARVLRAARDARIPIVYTKGDPTNKAFCGDSTKRFDPPEVIRERHSHLFPDLIAPSSDEYVLQKTKASAFFLTPLVTYLNKHKVDCLIVTGCSTSS